MVIEQHANILPEEALRRTSLSGSLRSGLRQMLLSASILAVFASGARGATFTVTNLNDSGAGSLGQAITDANSNPGPDTITFAVAGTINLTEATLSTTAPHGIPAALKLL